MGIVTKSAASILAASFMVVTIAPAAAQNIISPPPGTDVTILGVLRTYSPFGVGPGAGGPGNPGCPLILEGEVVSATPGVIRVDKVTSCKIFTVPIFFRYTSPATGTIDLLEATGLSYFYPNDKCGATDVFFTWSNPRYMDVPLTDGEVSPGIQACSFEIDFTLMPDIHVQ